MNRTKTLFVTLLLLAGLMPAMSHAQSGLTYTFDHVVVTGSTLVFDVMVAGDGTTRLGDTQVIFGYNPLGLGQNAASTGNVTARPGPVFLENGYYDDPIASDTGPAILAFAMDFVGGAEDGVFISPLPMLLMRVEMAIENAEQAAGLSLYGTLMAGLQETSDGLVLGAITAIDSANDSLEGDGTTGIEFSFANCVVEGSTFSFDILVEATAEGTNLGDTQVYLNYNELGFGQAVAGSGNISATLGPALLANGNYAAPIINDNTASRVSVANEFTGTAGSGVALTTTPIVLLHVEMQVANANETAGLTFDEPLMEGQQFYDDQSTVYDPVIAADAKDDSLEEPSTGITFTFANCVIAGNTISFDIMVKGSDGFTRIGDTQVYLNYNAAAFGSSIVGSGALTVTRGAAFNNANYLDPFLQDNTSSKASLAMEFVGAEPNGTVLPDTPITLYHVQIQIADSGQSAGLSFDELLMEGNQFESDQATVYDPVVARDVKNDTLRDPVGIEFSFENCDVTANGLEFDVFVRGLEPGTRLGDTQVYLNYNDLAFGPAIATMGTISVSLAGDFSGDPNYNVINVVDNAADRVAVTVDFDGPEAAGLLLPDTPIALLHVTIQVQNANETSQISFEQALMAGQQFESNETIAYDPVIATDTKDEVLRDHIGITFTFANCVITENGLEYDILVQGDFDGTRLGDTQIYLNYNTAGFGTFVATNDNIAATLDPAFAANGNYAAPTLNDNTDAKVSLAIEYTGAEGDGELLPATPIRLVHVVMEIANPNESAGISFDAGLMTGQQFEDDQTTQYDPVVADDVKNDPLTRASIGITYTFDNCRYENGQFIFDVLIQADEPNRRLGDTQVYLNYNTAAFDSNVAASGAISAMLGTQLSNNGNYLTPIINDNTASRVSLATEFTGSTGDGILVPTTPTVLMTLAMDVADASEVSGLTFDEPLMQGQQFEDDQATAFDPVRADDTSCNVVIDPNAGQPIGMTFSFDNCRVENGKFYYDVFVRADQSGRRLGDSQVYINYNDLGFGPNVATNGAISVTLGPLFAANGNYDGPFTNDNTASRVSIATEFVGAEGDGEFVPTTNVLLLSVEMTIADANENSGLNFDEPLMQGQQFEDNQMIAFDPVRANDVSCDVPLGGSDKEPIGLTFSFANCHFENGYFYFDVLVRADEEDRRLGDAQVYVNYNDLGFGSNVVANGRITTTLGASFAANGNYDGPFTNDNTASRVSIASEFVGAEGSGELVPTTDVVLYQVQIQIADPSETAGLTFEESLMQGQQFEDDQMTAFDPVRANDTSCQDAPLGEEKQPIGLTFTLENCQVADGRFSFDVLIQSDEAGRRLGDTQIYLDYNALGFGPSVATNGNITVMLGTPLAANGNYATPIVNDNTASKVSISTEFTGAENDGWLVPTTSTQLLHVEIEIANGNENSGLNFDEVLMQGQQFEDDQTTAFDPVRANDSSCDVPLGGEDDPVGIHFEIDNCRIENGQLKYDVLASIAEGTRLLGNTETYLNYNPDGFGSNVVANGNVMVTLAPALTANYGPPVLTDNAPSRFGVDIDFTGAEANGIEITPAPVVLFSVMMDIAQDGSDENAGISFEQTLMAGRQFESDNTTMFEPVTVGTGCNLPLNNDDDDDGVDEADDFCPGTRIPEDVPTVRFSTNRWALVDHDNVFDTKAPNGQGPKRSYTTEDTGGCSCEQIIEELGLGSGHRKHGCSNSAMDDWVAHVDIQRFMARVSSAPDQVAALDAEIQALNADMPERFALEPVYPNPFNPEATVRFVIPQAEAVRVTLYDVQGRRIRVLYEGTPAAGQVQSIRLDGGTLPSGMYFVRLVSPSFSATQTALLVK